MKRRLQFVSIITSVIACVVFDAFAYTWTDPDTGITWTYNEAYDNIGGVTVVDVSPKPTGTLSIPAKMDGNHVVVQISCQMWPDEDYDAITNVVIPASVIRFDMAAFSGFRRITQVTISARDDWQGQRLSGIFPDCYQRISNVVVAGGSTLVANSFFAGCQGLTSIEIPSSVTRFGDYVFKDCSALKRVVFEGDAPDVGTDIYMGTPRSLLTYVKNGSIGWAGGVSTSLPGDWNGRAIAYADGAGGAGEASGNGQVTDVSYALSNIVENRAIASVTVSADCAIDEFVLKDGKVYDTMVRIVNMANCDVKLTLPSGYTYETFEGVDPLTIPVNSRNMLSITRTEDKTFLVTREKLKTIE